MKHLPLRAIAMVMVVLAGAACGTGSPSATVASRLCWKSADGAGSPALVG